MDYETSSPCNSLFNVSSLFAEGETSPTTFHNFLPLLKAIDMLCLMYFQIPEQSTNDRTINNNKSKD